MADFYRSYSGSDIVITGGEPAMQSDELSQLCKELKNISTESYITVETNGTFTGEFLQYIDLLSISPKLKNSIPFGTAHEKSHNINRINIEVLKSFHLLHKSGKIDIQWKFVICGSDDIDEIFELKNLIGFENKDVYLMPEGITSEEISSKRIDVINLCLKHKFNYSGRLHIMVWGNKRGV